MTNEEIKKKVLEKIEPLKILNPWKLNKAIDLIIQLKDQEFEEKIKRLQDIDFTDFIYIGEGNNPSMIEAVRIKWEKWREFIQSLVKDSKDKTK